MANVTYIDASQKFRILRFNLIISTHGGVDVDVMAPNDGSFNDHIVDLFDYELQNGETLHNVWYTVVNNLPMLSNFEDLNIEMNDGETIKMRTAVLGGAYVRMTVAVYALVYCEA